MNSGFKSFPKKLYGNTVKMLNITARAFGMSKPSEIFYSIKDGSWQDVTVWETVSGRVGRIPSASDDVYIKHKVVLSSSFSWTVMNLFVSTDGQLTSSGVISSLVVLGNFKSYGILSFTTQWNGNNSLFLCGSSNYVDKTKQTTSIDVYYSGSTRQAIIDMNYASLSIGKATSNATYGIGYASYPICSGEKYFTCDITTAHINSVGNTIFPCYMNVGSYNLTTTSNSTMQGVPFLSTGNNNKLIFGGTIAFVQGYIVQASTIVEFRGGVDFYGINFGTQWSDQYPSGISTGTGAMSFTTANQNISINSSKTMQFDCPITVSSGITVTLLDTTTSNKMQINVSLGGEDATANFINKGILYWGNSSSYTYANGTFDKDTFTNVVGYVFNGNATLPYLTYQGLYIAGTGIKTAPGAMTIGTTFSMAAGSPIFTAAGNITVGTNWSQLAGSVVNLLTYNLTVTGTTLVSGSSATRFNKTGAGALIFVGALTLRDACIIDMSGNPTVEFRGGFLGYGCNYTNSNFGTGAVSITTNNQSFSTISGGFGLLFGGTLTIASGITFTLNFQASIKCPELTGASGTAAFINKGFLAMSTTTALMSTGTADITTYANFIHYDFDGAHTLPYTTYYHLIVSGTGTKTLSGNTTTLGSFTVGTLSSTAWSGWNAAIPPVNGILDLSTYNLTVNGTFTTDGTVSENGSGANTHVFIGQVYFHAGTISFTTGNPNFEFRGGLKIYAAVSYGTGTLTFTTNNQSFTSALAGTPHTISSPITISGAITVTVDATPSLNLTLTGALNGNNAGSTFDNRSQVNYKSATRPMVTGVLQTNAAANTWIYGLNNQDIKGGTYRTLILNGTGVKTLQGNVVVATTYTLTAPATLALNGFTRT